MYEVTGTPDTQTTKKKKRKRFFLMNINTKFLSKIFANESKITSKRLAKPCPGRIPPRDVGMVQHSFEFEFHFLRFYDIDNFLFSGPIFGDGLVSFYL